MSPIVFVEPERVAFTKSVEQQPFAIEHESQCALAIAKREPNASWNVP